MNNQQFKSHESFRRCNRSVRVQGQNKDYHVLKKKGSFQAGTTILLSTTLHSKHFILHVFFTDGLVKSGLVTILSTIICPSRSFPCQGSPEPTPVGTSPHSPK